MRYFVVLEISIKNGLKRLHHIKFQTLSRFKQYLTELYAYISDRIKNSLPEAYLFANPNTGKPYSKNALQTIWYNIRAKMGLDKGFRLYDITRHSFASNLVNTGSSIYKVSRLLGHSSIKMTERYAHSEVESLRTDLEKLSLNCHQNVIKGISNAK